MSTPVPTPPQPAPPGPRESFQAFARSDSREELMADMRTQAEAYFGCKVALLKSSAQPCGQQGAGKAYQGSSFWQARP